MLYEVITTITPTDSLAMRVMRPTSLCGYWSASVSINTCRLYERRKKEKEDLDKTLQNLSLLYSIGKAMNYISDLKNLLQYILSQAIDITFV